MGKRWERGGKGVEVPGYDPIGGRPGGAKIGQTRTCDGEGQGEVFPAVGQSRGVGSVDPRGHGAGGGDRFDHESQAGVPGGGWWVRGRPRGRGVWV